MYMLYFKYCKITHFRSGHVFPLEPLVKFKTMAKLAELFIAIVRLVRILDPKKISVPATAQNLIPANLNGSIVSEI